MNRKYKHWNSLTDGIFSDFESLVNSIKRNREFEPIDNLDYGDHGLLETVRLISEAISSGKKVALYADYDVDGTMSLVSWIWFFEAIGFKNYLYYIPCRFKEGYGLNLDAVKSLVDQGIDLLITMDTGITANEEAEFCRSHGVDFICTDHHKINKEKMPDCTILNPKQHPDPIYQELCGCGITFVLLRKLAKQFDVGSSVWIDLLALAGMATICDVVPLNSVNHKLAKLGINALLKSDRLILKRLREASSLFYGLDESDIGFRIGPRINAVGRLEHAEAIVKAFTEDDPEPLVELMNDCNERRKELQNRIYEEACEQGASQESDPILFLGGDWHQGVVGIAASKLVDKYWKPTWLFSRKGDICLGSVRSIPGYDVTDAMASVSDLFIKFGGHKAAGGFSFAKENEEAIRKALCAVAESTKKDTPEVWESSITYDGVISEDLIGLPLVEKLNDLKPFGHGFNEPLFRLDTKIEGVRFFKDKKTGEPKHTSVSIRLSSGKIHKVIFFNEVLYAVERYKEASFLINISKNNYAGRTSVNLIGRDWNGIA